MTRTRARLAAIAVGLASLTLLPPSALYAEAAASAQVTPAEVVNINNASSEELQRLPGVGPTRAQAILELRARLKQFARLEQLLAVKGIGRATFRKLRPLLCLSGPTTLREKPSAR
jgi:competence protein ComEA